jgi:hypothetical protein
MSRILNLRKQPDEDMQSFRNWLERELESIGLENSGRVGEFEVAGPNFPSTYIFESSGEGGFVVEYAEAKKVYEDSTRTSTTHSDAGLIPVGATGSLVQRVYGHLKQTRPNSFEFKVN